MWLVWSKCYHANNIFFTHFVSLQIRYDRSQRVNESESWSHIMMSSVIPSLWILNI